MSVIVPLVVPFTRTLAPITGSPFSSTTVPLIIPFCAKTAPVIQKDINIETATVLECLKEENIFFLSIDILFLG